MRSLQLWVLPGRGLGTLPSVREQLRDFLREHPDTVVDVKVRTPGTLWSQLFALLKRSPSEALRPHVVEIPSHWTSTLAALGLLEDLTDLEPGLDLGVWASPSREHARAKAMPAGAEPARRREDAPPPEPASGAEREEGRPAIHSLPWWMETPVLYYRPDLLKRAGVEPERLETWSSLREACRQLGRRLPSGAHPIANGNPRDSVSLADLAPSVWSRGGDFFSRDGSRALFQREEAYRGIWGYLELIERGWMPLLGKSGLVTRSLFDGGAALQFSGRIPARQRRGGVPVRATPTPRGEEARAGVLVAHHLAILRGSGHSREALGLLLHLTRPSNGARYAAALGALPCGPAELEAALSAAGDVGPALRVALGCARTLPNFPALGTLERILDRCMENLLRAILRRTFDQELLRQELIYAAAEMDYVLSMAPA